MVWKKKGNVEQEVQEGWMGRIIPFELAQKELLAGELAALKAHEDRLAEISGSYEEALDGLSEEDKEADFVNEDKTAFVWAEVKKAIKAKEVEPEVLAALKKVSSLNAEEKALKKQIKTESAALHQKTKTVIEALSEEQVLRLLECKWIAPLAEELNGLPGAVVDTLAKQVSALSQKYALTLTDLEGEIQRTEQEFSAMLDQLTGSEYDRKGLAELQKLLRG
jgi:type I restriction enzyme M protein